MAEPGAMSDSDLVQMLDGLAKVRHVPMLAPKNQPGRKLWPLVNVRNRFGGFHLCV